MNEKGSAQVAQDRINRRSLDEWCAYAQQLEARVSVQAEEIQRLERERIQLQVPSDESSLDERASLDEATQLLAAAKSILGASSTDEICELLIGSLNGLVGADSTTIYLVDREAACVTHAHFHRRPEAGLWDLQESQMTYPELMAGLSGQVITSGEPMLSRHPGDGLEPPETIARRRAAGSGSLIVIPLATPAGAIGTLTAHNRAASRVFSARDVDLLMALARQAAAAIQNAQLAEDVRRLARIDSLTGLLTRYESLRSAERELKHCQRRGQPFALLMWDIDFFKRVNDTYGHMTGDEVLRGLGAVFSRLCRPYDIMGRIGGEEFFGFFPESTLPVGQMIAERLRAGAAAQSFGSAQGPLSVTISVGVVATTDADVSVQTLMGRADLALYRSKGAGRNCVTTWEAGWEQ